MKEWWLGRGQSGLKKKTGSRNHYVRCSSDALHEASLWPPWPFRVLTAESNFYHWNSFMQFELLQRSEFIFHLSSLASERTSDPASVSPLYFVESCRGATRRLTEAYAERRSHRIMRWKSRAQLPPMFHDFWGQVLDGTEHFKNSQFLTRDSPTQ